MDGIEIRDDAATWSFSYDRDKVALCRALSGRWNDPAWRFDSPYVRAMFADAAQSEGDFYTALRAAAKDRILRSKNDYPCDTDYAVPPGLSLLSHQKSAIDWIVTGGNSVLEMDSMGAGKTIICAAAANHLRAKRVLIICLASVRTNWRNQWRKWNLMANNGETAVATAHSRFWPGTDVVIVNFDIVHQFRTVYDERGRLVKSGDIDAVDWDMVIVDESHKIKGTIARRSRAIVGYSYRGVVRQTGITGKRKIALTGTPILNRPKEAFTTLFWLWPESFPNRHLFGLRYCNGQRGSHGWRFNGESNGQELNARCRILGAIGRPVEITHRNLPPKSRIVIDVDAAVDKPLLDAIRVEGELEMACGGFALAESIVGDLGFGSSLKTLIARKSASGERDRIEVAMRKIPAVVEHIKDRLDYHEKIVVFTWHVNVAKSIVDKIDGAMLFIGETPTDARQDIIDAFQRDPTRRVLVGTIGALGTGVTLTAANLAIFVELYWVPGDMLQAEDRLNRPGQTRPIQIHYMAIPGSIDSKIAQALSDKYDTIEKCFGAKSATLDFDLGAETPDLPAAARITVPELERLAETVDSAAIETTRDKMRALSQGHANVAQLDQIVASRLSGLPAWTKIQSALAEWLARNYFTGITK